MGLSRQQLFVVIIFLAGGFVAVLNQTLLSPALPVIMNDLAIDAPTVQWLTSGYSLVEAVVFPLSAYFIGRFPTRKLFIGGMSLFTAGTFLAAFAPVFSLILLGRMLQAGATGVVWSMVMTVILLIFPRERRGSAMGLVGLVIGFAPAIGPSISGILVDTIGWRFEFMIVGILMAVVVILAIFVLKNYGDFERVTFDKLSVALSLVGLLSLLYGLSSITSTDQVWLCIGLIILGAVCMTFFVIRQFKLATPLVRIEVLKTRNFRVDVILVAGFQAVMISTGVLLPIYVQNLLGYSPLDTGFILLPGALGGAIIGLVAGRLFDRFGVRRIAVPGALLACIGGVGYAFFNLESSLLFITLANAAFMIGMQFATTPLNTWGINSLDNSRIQHANAVSNTVNQIMVALGTAVLVTLSTLSNFLYTELPPLEQSMAGYHIAFIAVGVIVLAIFIGAFACVRDRATASSNEIAPVLEEVSIEDDVEFKVGEVMTLDPYFVRTDDTIRTVARVLTSRKTSGVPVVDDDDRVVGFIADGDIMRYIESQDSNMLDSTNMLFRYNDRERFTDRIKELLELNVMRIATRDVASVETEVSLEDVCRIFAQRRIKKMPVVESGKLVGTISRSDIIRATMVTISEQAIS